jgi:hypothetical protein
MSLAVLYHLLRIARTEKVITEKAIAMRYKKHHSVFFNWRNGLTVLKVGKKECAILESGIHKAKTRLPPHDSESRDFFALLVFVTNKKLHVQNQFTEF